MPRATAIRFGLWAENQPTLELRAQHSPDLSVLGPVHLQVAVTRQHEKRYGPAVGGMTWLSSWNISQIRMNLFGLVAWQLTLG